MSDYIVARIGREFSPAERSLANARERAEVAEYHGRNLFHARTGGTWLQLSQHERAAWINAALSMMEDHAARVPDPQSPDPPGGNSVPLEAVA